MENKAKYKKECFFCSQDIIGKKSQEHIIPNSLLGKLGIKEEIIDSSDYGSFQYSRIKVPAHGHCNSEFGSEYEDKIITYLEDPDTLFEELVSEEDILSLRIGPSNSVTSLFTTWLSKIYYGLFYNDLIKINDKNYFDLVESIVFSKNFNLVRESYKMGLGFSLPSSLYVFKSSDDDFDLQTLTHPQTIMIKINSLIFILSIADGQLCKKYLSSDTLTSLRNLISEEKKANPEFMPQKYALAEVAALNLNIPKKPSFLVSKNEIINMSFSTMAANSELSYQVDNDEIDRTRNEILKRMLALQKD